MTASRLFSLIAKPQEEKKSAEVELAVTPIDEDFFFFKKPIFLAKAEFASHIKDDYVNLLKGLEDALKTIENILEKKIIKREDHTIIKWECRILKTIFSNKKPHNFIQQTDKLNKYVIDGFYDDDEIFQITDKLYQLSTKADNLKQRLPKLTSIFSYLCRAHDLILKHQFPKSDYMPPELKR